MKRYVFFLILLHSYLSALSNEEYALWWNTYRTNPAIANDLREMEDYFVNSGLLIYSSNFWNDFNKLNIEQLAKHGFENFKQTVAGNYFTWKVSIDHPYAQNLKKLVPKLNVVFSSMELNRKHRLWTKEESRNFNTITMYYLNHMLNLGWGSYIEQLEEPLIGNPPYNLYKGKRVSQDIFNSLMEYLSVVNNCPMDEVSTIAEVGAGYGRTSYCFLHFHPEKKYIIIDFPPALYVSQQYLSKVFPDRFVMKFRPFDSFAEVCEEFEAADIIFITPDQLSKIPDNSIDLFLAIDCLHEMKSERVAYYFDEAQRLCNYFYFKCWVDTYICQDNVNHDVNTYPVKSSWNEIFKQPCEVPSGFFHAMYKLN